MIDNEALHTDNTRLRNFLWSNASIACQMQITTIYRTLSGIVYMHNDVSSHILSGTVFHMWASMGCINTRGTSAIWISTVMLSKRAINQISEILYKSNRSLRCFTCIYGYWLYYSQHHFYSSGPLFSGFNTLRPRQNKRHFADDIFKCIFLNENVWIPIKISLKFVPQGPIHNISALVQIMAWRRSGDKPLSGPMIVRLSTHTCVTRPHRS